MEPTVSKPLGLPLDSLTRSLIDTKAFAVIIADYEGNIVDCNDETLARLKYSRPELLTMTIADINPDLVSIEKFRTEFCPKIMAGGRVDLTMKHRRKDGFVFPVEIAAHMVEIEDTKYCCAFIRDVRESNIRTLREVNDRLKSTIYVYDLVQDRNLYINQNIGIEMGYSADETVEMGDRLIEQLMHPDDVSKIQHHHENVVSMADGECRNVEYRMRHRDGEYRRLHSRDAVFKRDDEGQVIQIVGVATVLDEIETLRLQTKQLQIANDELKHFAYVASHDLKAPLRGISHLTGWLREDSAAVLSAESLQYLDQLDGRIQRMNDLLDSLLEYSRVGRTHQDVSEFHLGELVDMIVDLLPKPKTFIVERIGLDIMVQGHKAPLIQVLQNLIGNAIKHCSRDDATVVVQATVLNQRIKFSVSDNGTGIEERFRDRVFEMFQSLARGDAKSTGIGLTIARKQVRQYGGELLLVDSAAGQGCRFEFDWPTKI